MASVHKRDVFSLNLDNKPKLFNEKPQMIFLQLYPISVSPFPFVLLLTITRTRITPIVGLAFEILGRSECKQPY